MKKSTLFAILFAVGLLMPSFVFGVEEYCFYFINGGVGEDCYPIIDNKIDKSTVALCNVYANQLKTGGAVIANLAGGIKVDVAMGCPKLSLGTDPDPSENIPLVSIKTPKKGSSINFGDVVGSLMVDTDFMAEWAGKIGKQNGFVESVGIWLLSQNQQQEIDFENKFTTSIKTFLEKERDKLCCVSPEGSGTEEKFSCSMPTSNDSEIQKYVSGVVNYIKSNNGPWDASGAFEEFTKLKKVDLYKCGDNLLANPKLYEYSCTDTNHTNILPSNQSGSLSGSLSELCNLSWGEGGGEKVIPPPENTALDLGALQAKAKTLNKLSVKNIPELIGTIIKAVMGITGSIALVMIIYGGVLFMFAAGNAERTKKGMDIIIWSALGIVVIFASYSLVDLVFDIFR